MKTRIIAVLGCLAVVLSLTVSAASAGRHHSVRPHGKVTLYTLGDKRVGHAFDVKGNITSNVSGHNKRVLLQRQTPAGHWVLLKTTRRQNNGTFYFRHVKVDRSLVTRLRAKLYYRSRHLDNSNTPRLNVLTQTCSSDPSPVNCVQPSDKIQTRDVVDPPVCDPAGGGTQTTEHQSRHQPYVWDPVAKEWTPGDPGPWSTDFTDIAIVGTDVCPVPVVVTAMLPDLAIQKLTTCSSAEHTGSTDCFRIVTPADGTYAGKKLLKFPVVTENIGDGAMEIHAARTSTSDTWSSFQRIFNSDGSHTDQNIPNAEFTYAGDGHNHWHIVDFDSYQILGTSSVQEKHGYCLSDNFNQTGAPPVYPEQGACGAGQPDTLAFMDGLSVGWGDTYPSTLDNQAIDITGLADGTYTVQVCADQLGLLQETNENNNCASVSVAIAGDTVTPDPTTATGL